MADTRNAAVRNLLVRAHAEAQSQRFALAPSPVRQQTRYEASLAAAAEHLSSIFVRAVRRGQDRALPSPSCDLPYTVSTYLEGALSSATAKLLLAACTEACKGGFPVSSRDDAAARETVRLLRAFIDAVADEYAATFADELVPEEN